MEVGRNTYGYENITVYECYKKNTNNDNILGIIKIGSFCGFSENVKILLNWDYNFDRSFIYPFVTLKTNKCVDLYSDVITDIERNVVIKNDVQIGNNTVIFGGAIIGNGSIILPDSVVVDDVPNYSIVKGTPAKVIGYRYDDIIINKLLNLKWWEFPDIIIHNFIHLITDRIDNFISCLEGIKSNFLINLAIKNTRKIPKKIVVPITDDQLIINNEKKIKQNNDVNIQNNNMYKRKNIIKTTLRM